jgi:hypothetical protein
VVEIEEPVTTEKKVWFITGAGRGLGEDHRHERVQLKLK